MLDIRADSIIRSLKDLLMPNHFHNYDCERKVFRGLILSFDITISERDTNKEDRKAVHVLVAGNSNAFVAESGERITSWNYGGTVWKNVGNHDSCWIDSIDTELSQLYFRMCETVNKDVAPVTLNTYNTMNVFCPITLVEVALESDVVRNKESGSSGSYWKLVKSIKKLTKAEFNAYEKE